MKEVRIACQGADVVDIEKLILFQGELKSLSKEQYAQLRNSILETGFAFPILVWGNGPDLNIVGGHQRIRVLKELRAEGYHVPPVPISYVEADSIEQAKRRVLQDVAQYGQIERQGLYQFMTEWNISPGELAEAFKLPNLDLSSFNTEFFFDEVGTTTTATDKVGSKEYSEESFQKFDHQCPRCGFSFDD